MVDKEERNFLFILLVSILFLNIYLCQKTKIDEGFNPVREIRKLGNTVSKLPNTIKKTTTGMINKATSAIKREFNGIINQLESTFTGLINQLNNVINQLESTFTGLINQINNTIKKIIKSITELPRTIVKSVVSLIPNRKIKKYFIEQTKEKNIPKMLLNLAIGMFKLAFVFFIMPYLIIFASYQGIVFGVSSMIKAMVMSFSYMINPPKKNVDLSMLGDVLDIQEQMSSNQEQKLNQLQQKLGKMDRMINR